MPIEAEGLEHSRECPECKGALIESVGYDLCPHCGHRLGDKTSKFEVVSVGSPWRTRQWQCPECNNWDYEGLQPHGGAPWHDCKNCGYQEGPQPRDHERRYAPPGWDEDEQGAYDYDEWYDKEGNPHEDRFGNMEEQYPEDAPHDQLDDPWNQGHHAKFQVIALGEMQQPGGVGATQTAGPTDGEGIQHPDDHSDMADAGQNSFEQNVALETWVNFAVDMLNRGKSEQEVSAQLAHDGCPEPDAVLQRAQEQPQQDPVGSDGAQDPFEIPYQNNEPGGTESVHTQPPVMSHWLESPEDKPTAGQQIRIAGTSWRGIELERWEDLYGQQMARVALNDGGIITVAAEVIEADGERKIADPATEIQSFIDGLPEVEPTRPSIIARIANLKLARQAVHSNISKVGFSDQVKLERLDRNAQTEISELVDFLGRVASDTDQQYVREQQRYRQAGQHNRERVSNAQFNSRIAETAAIFVQELAPETRADAGQVAYAAAHFATQNNGDVGAFVAAVQKVSYPNQRDPGEVDAGWPVRGTGDFPADPKRDEWAEDDDPNAPGRGAFDHLRPSCPNCGGTQFNGRGLCLGCGVDPDKPEQHSEGSGGMSDEDYWSAREMGAHPDHNPEDDPFAIWPGGHPMDR